VRVIVVLFFFFGVAQAQERSLLFYCGATMVKPMQRIAELFSREHPVNIQILQGGSGDLLRRLKTLKKGDLYLPGSSVYLDRAPSDLFIHRRGVGVNRLAILVKKGNPLGIKTLEDLTRPDLRVAIGAADLGSIGRITKKVLLRYGGDPFYSRVQNGAMYFVTDSRELVQMLIRGKIDAGISWKATAFFPENRLYIEAIPLPERIAPPQKLELAVTRFSREKKMAREFTDFAASERGTWIMKAYGFQ